ncbi:hypothetical protein CY35_02G067900 [Sphagnum magellanicum]|jgi:hypothetical protein|nr:hypothetical protein CY35_02G067900 [Sphagnum magellanicum]
MAHSAWSTEYFDQNVQSQEKYAGTIPTIPPMYTQPASVTATSTKTGRLLGGVSIVLRVATILFSLIAVGLMVSWSQTIEESDGTDSLFTDFVTLTFSGFAAYDAVVAVNVIVTFYAIVQLIHTSFILGLGKVYPQPVVALAIISFVFDLVLAFVLIAASAAGTAITAPQLYTNVPKAQAALAFSFVAFLFLAVSSVLSARRLFQMK